MRSDDSTRYCRQTILPQIGPKGQARLAEGTVVVAGCGALGAASAMLLVRAGVGRVRVVDRDFVELSNLQRQTLYSELDVESGLPKAAIAQERLQAINSSVRVEGFVADVNAANAESLFAHADVIVDAIDNFEARYLINDVALKHGIPWVYGAVIGTYGLSMTIRPGKGPCLRCLLPEPPAPGSVDTCATAGIFGPIVEAISALQVTETAKLLLGAEEDLAQGLVQLDVWDRELTVVDVPRLPGCPACGRGDYQFLRAEATAETISLCGRNAMQISGAAVASVSLPELASRLSATADVTDLRANPFMVRFTAQGHEINVFADGRAIINGTTDATEARMLYAKYVGT